MAISIRKWLVGKLFGDGTSTKEVSCDELFKLTEDFRIRELTFNTCVNMIANAVGKCEFKTFQNRKPVQKVEFFRHETERKPDWLSDFPVQIYCNRR